MGITPERFNATSPAVQDHLKVLSTLFSPILPWNNDNNPECYSKVEKVEYSKIETKHEKMKIIVSVDELDFCKGIPEKLAAYELLLDQYPEWRKRVIMFLLVPDDGGLKTHAFQYKVLNRQINEMVGRVNGKYGSAQYLPIRYLKNPVSADQLTALVRLEVSIWILWIWMSEYLNNNMWIYSDIDI